MGEVFAGRYELADPIGRGGVGAVWRAWDHRRRRYVAAKVLLQSDAHSLLRFVREQALRIDHPHVLAPTSWAADDDQVLFTMDLVAGGSLVHLVGDYGPLPPPFVCTLLDQLLAGLAAVHAEGVVHRDIKPANVLLEATGTGRPRLRLSDFGIAMRLGEPRLTETNLVVGTPGYLAPEQMMGSEPDFPADLFAVGLVALYLLEGAKPDTKALIQYFADHGTPGAPQGIPEPLWQVVATLLQPDPDARFRTVTGARKALTSAAELLPEPGPDDELIEIFDQLGPLPPGFGPAGPLKLASGVRVGGSGTSTATTKAGRPPAENPRPVADPDPEGSPGPPGVPEPRHGNGAEVGLTGTGTGEGESEDSASGAPAHGPTPHSTPGTGTGADAGAGAGTRRRAGTDAAPTDPRRASPVTGTQPPAPPQQLPPHHPQQPQPHPSQWQSQSQSQSQSSMSDTGSFHLPPPEATSPAPAPSAPPPPAPQPPGIPPHAYANQRAQEQAQAPDQAQARAQQALHTQRSPATAPGVPPHDPTHPLRTPLPPRPPAYSAPARLPLAEPSTAEYTARDPQVPPPGAAFSPDRPAHRAHRRRSRPGPPAKVAVPLLLLALACYAVGFWALGRI
ncbi:serine/threonine-protein kinase [Streptomyces sp. NPDC101219]|uniref:serine/threonine-protein kinase n=1 Tax=Streptomyces sp. NPDC101219 TaxID=3366131 RepID=UPI003830737A